MCLGNIHFDFSVIIPSYNSVELFQEALTSVLRQKNVTVEIIVSDDSYTSDIKECCEKISLKIPSTHIIRYIHRENPDGAVKNWNNGLKYTSGDYIMVLHHDERLSTDNQLQNIIKILQKYDIAISNIEVHDNGKIRRNWIPKWIKLLTCKIPEIIFIINAFGPCACFAFRKKILTEFDTNLVWLVDCEWYYQMLKSGEKIKFLNDNYIFSQNGHEGQITKNIDIKSKHKSDVNYLFKKYKSKPFVKFVLYLNVIFSEIKSIIK